MSLINRICLTNYANVNGSDRKNWVPLYTHAVLDFGGQNGIIVIDNGGGKTTLANALIGLLSRHKTLVTKMREVACPPRAPDGMRLPWSHIRVELVVPETRPDMADLLVRVGNRICGKTMVFGVATHCEGDAIYYCFPGKLEDLPTVLKDEQEQAGTIQVVSNEAFQKAARQVPEISWNMSLADWRHKVLRHFPEEMLKGLAQFQLRGGQDRGAQLFAMLEDKKKSNKAKEEALFYEVLAPELMHGLLEHRSGDPDKGSIEENLFGYLRDAVLLRRKMERKKKEIQEKEGTLADLEKAGKEGEQAHGLLRKLEQVRHRHALDIAVMHEVVRNRPMPGIPRCAPGGDECSALANRLVVLPGEHYPRVPDEVLAGLLEIEVRRLNERATRMRETGGRNTQVIEIPCDLDFIHSPKREHTGGHRTVYYTPDQAQKILLKQGAKGKADLLEDAITLFDREMDTNPWREDLAAVEAQISMAAQEINRLRNDEIPRLLRQENDLQSQRKEAQVNQHAFADLEGSGLFTREELAAPRETGRQVAQEVERWKSRWDDFRNRSAQLQTFYKEWRKFQERFGDAEPAEILAQRETAQQEIVSRRKDLQASLKACDEKLKEIRQSLVATGLEKARHEEKLAVMERLASDGAKVLDTLREDEMPQARLELLENRIKTALEARALHERRIERMQEDLRRAQKDLQTLQSLRDAGSEALSRLRDGETPVDYENRLRGEREAAREAAEAAGQALEEARKGLEALEQFERVVGRLAGKWAPKSDPLSWFHGLRDLYDRKVLENKALEEARETLERQLAALKEERIAATGEAHTALAMLGDEGVTFQHLHEHILGMPIAENRKAELLERFSPFLFAPVVDSSVAEHAARRLHEHGLSVPVFIASRLTAWCEGKVGQEVLAWQALHTRTADFLLNPDLRQEEMARIENRLEENRRRHADNAALLADIAPQGELMQLWPPAEKAREKGYREKLPELERADLEARERLARHDRLLSEKNLKAIRAAADFWARGGEDQLSELRSRIDTELPRGLGLQERLRKQAEEAEAFHQRTLEECRGSFHAAIQFHEKGGQGALERLREHLRALDKRISELNAEQSRQERNAEQLGKDLESTEEDLRQVLPRELHVLLKRMVEFVALDGPAFMEAAPEQEREIEAAWKRANERNAYARQFEPAQKWVEYQKTQHSGEGVEKALARVRRQIEDAHHQIKAQEESVEELKDQRALLKSRVTSLDETALMLLSRYPGKQPRDDIPCDAAEMENHPVRDAVESLRDALKSLEDDADDSLVQLFENVVVGCHPNKLDTHLVVD